MTKLINCPQCGKVSGEYDGHYIRIRKVNILIAGASVLEKKCSRCGAVFDMIPRSVKVST